jgi:AcrR family transcriptional regulator
VLDTARRLFAGQGFAATSLQQIADAMDVRKANVYYYFRTKDAILNALLEERITALEVLLSAAEALETRRARQNMLIEGFVEQVVIAHRTVAPVDFTDPAVRGQAAAQRLESFWTRAALAMFGPDSTPDDRAALAMLRDLRPALLQLTHLPDDEVRSALRRLCLRVLPGDVAGAAISTGE